MDIDINPLPAEAALLETQAQTIIAERARIILNWLREQLPVQNDTPSSNLLPDPQRIQAVLDHLAHDNDGQQHLYALAERLNLIPLAWQIALRQCHKHGCFDCPKSRPARIDQRQPEEIQPIQPDRREILPHVRALLKRVSGNKDRIQALVQEGFCRNRGNAQAVVAFIERYECTTDKNFVVERIKHGHMVHQTNAACVVEAFRAVIRDSTTDQHIEALVQAGLCLSQERAQTVVDHLVRRNEKSDRYRDPIIKSWERGLFNKLPSRSVVDMIHQRVAAIFAAVTDDAARVQLLLWSGLCQQAQQAQQVVAVHSDKPSTKEQIHDCWTRGLFDLMPPSEPTHHPYAIRPPFHEVERHIKLLCTDSIDTETQFKALLALKRCRDEATAQRVVNDLDQHNRNTAIKVIAATLARRVLKSASVYRMIGLLTLSDYAPTDVLIWLERTMSQQEAACENPLTMLATLRRDLVAIYRAFERVDSTLWKRDLLDSPVVSEARTYCQRCILPEQRTQIIAAIQTQYDYSEDEAATIFTLMVERSGFGVIDWRCGIPLEQAGHNWEKRRLRRILKHHLGALKPEQLNHIESQVHVLKEAMQKSGVTVSLIQLLNSQPYGSFRRRLNRRLPLAYGQVQFFRRNDSWERRKHRHYRSRFRESPHGFEDNPLARASALVEHFSSDEKDGANRLYQVRTYGGIGFIPKDDWLSLIDSRLLALLKFYKFVRIEGRFDMQQALQQVNSYAKQLGLTPLSAQLAKALNGAMQKPRRWNGGESERTAMVRTNAKVVLPGKPWLHRVWRLFHIPLSLPIAASAFSTASERSHLLLVVDLGSQLPLGLWVSAHPPRITEVGLALFQSIWHPGVLDWPLRGAPEMIQLPASLLADNAHNNAYLSRAATWLLMQVQIVDDATQTTILKKLPVTQALIDDLVFVGLDTIRHQQAVSPLTVKNVQDALLSWIRMSKKGFANHTPGLDDPVSVMYGLTTPAFQTPVAGFLLPAVGEARTVKNGVLIGDRFYTSANCAFAIGQMVKYHTFPYQYQGYSPDAVMQDAIYVRDQDGMMHYLVRHLRI